MLEHTAILDLDHTFNFLASLSQRLSVTNTHLSLYCFSEAKPSTLVSKQTLNEDLQRLDVTVDSARIDTQNLK